MAVAVRAAVDIGGTFTDVVVFDDVSGVTSVGKMLTTPGDLLTGIFAGVEASGARTPELVTLVHGSTLVINALTERRGARVALVTTEGFRDVYEIGRTNRPDAFNVRFTRPRPLTQRDMVFEIRERMLADGSVACALDEESVAEVARRIVDSDAEAVAVCLLHAYRNPAHERRVGELLARACPGLHVTLSHRLSREYREYERTSTTVANAYVAPIVSDYLTRLEQRVSLMSHSSDVLVMQSSGGLTGIDVMREQCVHMMESGPAGGVIGTIDLCRTLGIADAIAFDMGGTTAKAAVIRDHTFPEVSEYFVGGYLTGLPVQIPCLDIVEVGTGGGSVAWVDAVGGLHVGPRSVGAEPGPACFGRGGAEATVTDAAVVLGLLSTESPLSGELTLDAEAALASVDRIGAIVGVETTAVAGGIIAIAAASMANAVRAVTTERGLDPRDFTLVAYGGNGPLHVSLVARELGITRVVVPVGPSVFSAYGMLTADLRHDVAQTWVERLERVDATVLAERFAELGRECAQIAGADLRGGERSLQYRVDMRYVGQEHTLTVEVPDLAGFDPMDRLKSAFDDAHLDRFAHGAPQEPAEIVNLRVSLVEKVPSPEPVKTALGGLEPVAEALTATRIVRFGDEARACPVFERAALLGGNVIEGPAVIAEGTTTTLLREGDLCEVDPWGNLLLTIGRVP